MLTSHIFSDFNVHHLLICVLCRKYDVVCIALLLFDYNGQLLEHAICLVVLFFCHFIVFIIVFLNEIDGDRCSTIMKNNVCTVQNVVIVVYRKSLVSYLLFKTFKVFLLLIFVL